MEFTIQQLSRHTVSFFWHRPHAIRCVWSPLSPHLPPLNPLPLCLQPLSTGVFVGVTLGFGHGIFNKHSSCAGLGHRKKPSCLAHNKSLLGGGFARMDTLNAAMQGQLNAALQGQVPTSLHSYHPGQNCKLLKQRRMAQMECAPSCCNVLGHHWHTHSVMP